MTRTMQPEPGNGPAGALRIDIRQASRPRLGDFSPLASPKEFSLSLAEVSVSALDHLKANVALALRPGEVHLSIFEEEPLPAEVLPDCTCHLVVAAGEPEDGSGERLVTAFELTFDRPLVLRNILSILARLQSRFADYEVNALLNKLAAEVSRRTGIADLTAFGRLAAGRLVKQASRFLPFSERHTRLFQVARNAALEGFAEAASVRLDRISGRPVKGPDGWQLELRFTGEWDLVNQVRVPFHNVKVHRAILPAPHALLENLMSAQPLATAEVRVEDTPALDLAQQLGTMVSSLHGTVHGAGQLPDLVLRTLLADEGTVDLTARAPGPLAVEATFSGTVSTHALEVKMDPLRLTFADDRELVASGLFAGWTGETGQRPGYSDTAVGRCLESLYTGEWSSRKLGFRVHVQVADESRLPDLDLVSHYLHPLLRGGNQVAMHLADGHAGGEFGARFGRQSSDEALTLACAFGGHLTITDDSCLDNGRARLFPTVPGAYISGQLRSLGSQEHELHVATEAPFVVRTEVPTTAFPELTLEDGTLVSEIAGRIALDGRVCLRERGRSPFEADFTGTRSRVHLERATAELDGRTLTLPPGSTVVATVGDGVLAASGLGRARFDATWDFVGESPRLAFRGETVELFVPALRQGELSVHLSPAGGLHVSGPEWGLYDARYFNALLNPMQEPQRLLDILNSDEAVDRVFATLAVFSPDAVTWLTRLRDLVRRGQKIFEDEGIEKPADLIPAHMLARVGARLLFQRAELADALYPIVKGVTDGQGLDVVSLKRLLAAELPEHDFEFEVDRVLRLVARLVEPLAPPPPQQIRRSLPLAERAEYRERFSTWPDAATLAATVASREPLPRGFGAAVGRIAPYLTAAQVKYLLDQGREDWPAEVLDRLRHVAELKRRVAAIGQNYGGVAYAPQAVAISFFLADTIRMSRREQAGGTPAPDAVDLARQADVVATLLGPEDVATLLQAGLASAWSGRAVQLNVRMLLQLVFDRPPLFLRDVLVELGQHDPRVLAAALNGLLAMPQTAMAKRLDLVALLSERLGFEFPRLDDFLAGGRRANHSYYQALAKCADQVLAMAEPYRALKFTLQETRHPVPSLPRITARRKPLVQQVHEAIAAADKAAARCTFKGAEPRRRARATKAYEEAFAAVTALLEEVPAAFQLPPVKAFWQRNHEALMVRSVVRNVQQEVDEVPRWLAVRTGRPVPSDEQPLLGAVIEALYHFPEDRARLHSDPLVRLLLDPPEGDYDFTVVSAMGVITGGARGTELEQAYLRLEQERGIRTIRADTATGRDLRYNAARIIEAIAQVETPWGYIGYSQGCANGLTAESTLMGGPPSQRKLLDKLVCRNLLFSAFNASVHGTLGDQKFLDTLVYLDHFLAHYQARLSSRAIRTALRLLRLGLDSQPVITGMAGSRSLSVWGVLALHLGGQFKATVPTSTMRGVVAPEYLPEALEYLANVLTHQLGSPHHDTQVSVAEAQGHSILAATPQMELLERCDMGSLVQNTHHWSPLKEDTEFVTTQRDRDQAVYDFPKDRHVFPWVEVNARFGRIRTK